MKLWKATEGIVCTCNVKVTIVYYLTQCSLVEMNRRYRENCYLHHYPATPMTMETIALKTPIKLYHITRHHFPEEHSLHSHKLCNPESCSLVIVRIQWVGRVSQSVQQLTTGWTVRRSNTDGGEIIRNYPDRPCGPPSLLYNGNRVFPGGTGGREWG
jgi:hypothetical protein